jgi:hypothetical protein
MKNLKQQLTEKFEDARNHYYQAETKIALAECEMELTELLEEIKDLAPSELLAIEVMIENFINQLDKNLSNFYKFTSMGNERSMDELVMDDPDDFFNTI